MPRKLATTAARVGRIKRPPVYFTEHGDYGRYARLSKADWADAYVDLYAQVFGEQSIYPDILADAEHRIANLKIQEIR